jgi:hypothetical protein
MHLGSPTTRVRGLVGLGATTERQHSLRHTGRQISAGKTFFDDFQREKVIALLEKNPTNPVDVVLTELAITGGTALGIEKTLCFEEADLGDGDIGKLLLEKPEYLPDG